jgi:hypothetical protein
MGACCSRLRPTLLFVQLLQDPLADDPFYYQTSVQMVDRWTELNNYVAPNFGHGGHCHVHSTVRV